MATADSTINNELRKQKYRELYNKLKKQESATIMLSSNSQAQSMINTANDVTKKYSNIGIPTQRTSINESNRYSNDKLKNAQYEYDIKMHTPSVITSSIGSDVNLAGVVGSSFGHASLNTAQFASRMAAGTAREMTMMGAGAIAQDEGSRYAFDSIKFLGKMSAAAVGDVADIARKTNKAIYGAASQVASLNVVNLAQCNNYTLYKHFGTTNILQLGNKDVKEGCMSFLRSRNVDITDNLLRGNPQKVIKNLNRLLKSTDDADALMALNILKGNTLSKSFKPKLELPQFRLLRAGATVAGSLKNKFLSNEDLEGLSFIIKTKDRAENIAKNTLRFFQNTKKAAQRAASLARRGLLSLKKTKLYKKLYSKHIDKLIKKTTKKLSKKIGRRGAREVGKLAETAAKHSLREAMNAMARDFLGKIAGAVVKKIVATKVGAFIVEKVGETALAAVADFFAKWVPVVGWIYFAVEIVIVIITVVVILAFALQMKTAINDIGNVAAQPNEALLKYCDGLRISSDGYKQYYNAVLDRDSNLYLYDGRHVPKLLSRLTDNITVEFNDYLNVKAYEQVEDVNSAQLREIYGNQPEILMMAHVMSEMELHNNDPETIEHYYTQLQALYNTSHIMYITYYQDPIGKIYRTPQIEEIYKWEWIDGQYQKQYTNPVDFNTGHILYGEEVPMLIGQANSNPSTLNVSWNADVIFNVYYYEDLFDMSDKNKDNYVSKLEPQVYVKYNQGMNSVHNSKAYPINSEATNECIDKVYKAVSEKVDEKGIGNADIMAITAGIVANLISEGGCRGNNYEDEWNTNHQISDEQVTNLYNSYLDKSTHATFEDAWNDYLSGKDHGGVVLKGGYGIVQWTDETRKRGLFQKAWTWDPIGENQYLGTSIDNLDMQIAYMIDEMEGYGYFDAGGIFVSGANPGAIGYYLCQHYENPKTDGTDSKYKYRGQVAQSIYDGYNGIIGDIDYDDENMSDYVDFLTRTDDMGDDGSSYNVMTDGPLSNNYYIMNEYDENGTISYEQNANIFIAEYLSSQGCRELPPEGSPIGNLFFGNYGGVKSDPSQLQSGDILVWRDYAAIYIGNGKVLCPQSLGDVSSTVEIIGKHPLSRILSIFGGNYGMDADYVIVSPIKESPETEEPSEIEEPIEE